MGLLPISYITTTTSKIIITGFIAKSIDNSTSPCESFWLSNPTVWLIEFTVFITANYTVSISVTFQVHRFSYEALCSRKMLSATI